MQFIKLSYLLCAICILSILDVESQEVYKVEAQYSMLVPNSMSRLEARSICIQQARLKALEDQFGTKIFESTTNYTSSTEINSKEYLINAFNSISDQYVSGEWLRDLEDPIVYSRLTNEELEITAKVKGEIRKRKAESVPLNYSSLRCPDVKCNSLIFDHGDNYFLSFQSPVNGYLAIYWEVLEEESVYRILPIADDEYTFNVKKDSTYIFFDAISDNTSPELKVTVSDQASSEINRLILIFDKNRDFAKTFAAEDYKMEITKDNLKLPPKFDQDNFSDWLYRLQLSNEYTQVNYEYIQIVR